jgi:hypothetical protein
MILDVIESGDREELLKDNKKNLFKMRRKFGLQDNDVSILIDNVFKIYDAGIDKYKIPGEKHGLFLLATMHNYYAHMFAMMNEKAKGRENVRYKILTIDNQMSNMYAKILFTLEDKKNGT